MYAECNVVLLILFGLSLKYYTSSLVHVHYIYINLYSSSRTF